MKSVFGKVPNLIKRATKFALWPIPKKICTAFALFSRMQALFLAGPL